MNRKELKAEAKKVLKRNYVKCILIAFVVGVVLNTGYTYVSKNTYDDTKKTTQKTLVKEKKSNFNTIEDVLNLVTPNSNKSQKGRGVIAPIVNKVTEGKTPLISFLSSINLLFYKHNLGAALLSLLAAIILAVNYYIILNLITIGSNRFYLEIRRYNNTRVDKILFPYKKSRIPHLAFVMFLKKLYNLLWAFTIVGGIIKSYEYSMIPYILAENPNVSRKDAFKISKDLTNGYKWQLFKLDLSYIGWFLLGVVTLGISNILFFNAYRYCVEAEIYMKLRNEKHDKWKHLLNDKKLDIKEPVDDEYPELVINKKKRLPKTNYTKAYSVTSYILFFFTFSFIGWLWEVMLHLITDGVFVNRGVNYGPWLPIYGFGGVLILLLLKPLRNRQITFFIACIILAGIVEYSTSLYLETFKGMKWWDYTGYYLNINGRVCLEGLLVFGLGGCAVTYLVAPVLDGLYEKIKPIILVILCTILLLLFGADVVYSSSHPNSGNGITDYTG